ncbi:MAG: hypothetical protein OXI32_09565 [bacterium]|nr:hypothetical protein [bacterium]
MTAVLLVAIAVPVGATTGNRESPVSSSSSSERVPTNSGYFECTGNDLVKELGINYSIARGGVTEVEKYASFHIVPNLTDGNFITNTWNTFESLADVLNPSLKTSLIYSIPVIGKFLGAKSHVDDIKRSIRGLYARYWEEFVECKNLDPGIPAFILLNKIRAALDQPKLLRKLHFVKSQQSIYLQLICHVVGASLPIFGNILTGQTWDLEGYRPEPPPYGSIAELVVRYQCGWK